MKIGFLYLFIGFFLLVGLFSFFSKWGRIEEISFNAQKSWLKEEDQSQLINELQHKTQPFVGEWIWLLSIKKLKKIVISHPKVEQVQILRSWPHRFRVILLPKKPIFLLIGSRKFYPVTAKGGILNPVSNIQSLPDLPLLRGDVFAKQLQLRKQAVQLFLHLPEKGIFSQENISEVKYSVKDQNFYFYLLKSGLAVRVGGHLPDFRPDRIESVLKYLVQKKIKWRVIDARFSHKVIVSLDKDS